MKQKIIIYFCIFLILISFASSSIWDTPSWSKLKSTFQTIGDYFTKAETNILLADINSTIATKLNTSDQRYNDTSNIESRGNWTNDKPNYPLSSSLPNISNSFLNTNYPNRTELKNTNGTWNADTVDNLHALDINNSAKGWVYNGTLQLNNGTLQNTLIAGANITISGTTISVATGLYTNLKNTFDTLYTSAQGLFSNTNFTTQYYLIDSRYTDANISGSETAFNNWDKLSSDDYNTNNFSTDYTAQTGRYTDTNFSAKYNLMGAFTNTNFTGLNPFSNTNFSSQYNAQTDRYTNTNGSTQYTAQTGRYTIVNLTSDLANNPVNTTKNFNVNLKFNVTASTGIVSMSNNLTGVDCVVFKNGGAICGS